jgi:broad specificity phosphatase PhoE
MNASQVSLKLFLVRHGETAWSLSGQHTGVTDLPLTERGEEMARRLRPWLQGIAFSHVFCSPRRRAQRTCELAGVSPPPEIVEDLAEWNYGEYEGRRSVDIRKQRPGWEIFEDGCPGGESPEEIAARADRLIQRLLALSGEIALFSHGGFGRVLAARWMQAPVALGKHFALATGSLSILTFEPNHPETPVLQLWNATPAAPGSEAVQASHVRL